MASIEYERNLAHRYVYPKDCWACQRTNKDKVSAALTLGGNASTANGLSRETNDGYSANAIAEQFSMIGLEIEVRYTRTSIELCMRNCIKEIRAGSDTRRGDTSLLASNDHRASMQVVQEHTALHAGQDKDRFVQIADVEGCQGEVILKRFSCTA